MSYHLIQSLTFFVRLCEIMPDIVPLGIMSVYFLTTYLERYGVEKDVTDVVDVGDVGDRPATHRCYGIRGKIGEGYFQPDPIDQIPRSCYGDGGGRPEIGGSLKLLLDRFRRKIRVASVDLLEIRYLGVACSPYLIHYD